MLSTLYQVFKNVSRRTATDKALRDKAFNIARNTRNTAGCQGGLASMVYKYFNKKTSGDTVKRGIMLKQQLAEKFHEPISRKFEKRKVHSLL